MGSSLLTLSKGTWISQYDQTSHVSDNLMRSNWYTTRETAVAQFTIPQSLRYKRFVSAVLFFYSSAESAQGLDQGSGCRLSAYKTGDTLNQLIWSNMGALGERSEVVEAEIFSFRGDSFPRWRYIDVTGLFLANIVDATYFTVMINAMPGLTGYCGIGNVSLTGYETMLSLDYEDVPQLSPSPSYPVGTYVTENTDLLFAWNWESDTPATQAAVQLEYKLKTASTWTTVSLTQTTHTYLLSGGLAQGVYQWRIKGTNDAGEVSDYSSVAEFNVVGQPAAPVIASVPNKALTTITWTAADQNAFDIQITDSNSNVIINDSVASSTTSYKPNVFLKGTYTVKVRVRNSTGLISNWATASFTINASGPSAPAIQIYQNGTHVKIVTTTASNTNYAVVRTDEESGKEEILGTMVGGVFTDSTFGFGIPYKYVVRAWATGGYTDSAVQRICFDKTAIVIESDSDELVIDKSEDEYLPYAEDDTGETAVYNCIGRELPVVEHGAFESIAFKTRLFITNDEKPRLAAMKKKNRIYYRDYSGRAFPVAIQPPISFERWMDNGYMADIQFIRIADTEVVINV